MNQLVPDEFLSTNFYCLDTFRTDKILNYKITKIYVSKCHAQPVLYMKSNCTKGKKAVDIRSIEKKPTRKKK